MKRTVVGIIIVLAGVLLLGFNFGILDHDLKRIVFSWQMLLIAIGFTLLFDKKKNDVNGGIILMLIGFVFLLHKIFTFTNFSSIFIPALLITVGVFYIIRSSRRKNQGGHLFHSSDQGYDSLSFSEMPNNNSGYIVRDYLFSGSKERLTQGELVKADIDAIFSGVEVDFSQASLSEQAQVVHIKVSSVFSSVTVYIPSEWNVQVQKTGTFGDFTDRRPTRMVETPGSKLVILELSAVFGGGEIKCYE